MSEPMKRCTQCGEAKPLSDFHRHKREKDGYQPWCRLCRLAAKHEQRDHYREYNTRYVREMRARQKENTG